VLRFQPGIRTTRRRLDAASRIHHVGLPVSDLDLSVAWYREALGLTHESTAGVPGVLPSWSRRPASGSNCSQWMFNPLPGTTRSRGCAPGSPPTAWTVDDLEAAHARAVEAGGRSLWTPRDTPEPGLRIAFVADPDGNLVELLSSDEEAEGAGLDVETSVRQIEDVAINAEFFNEI
jgi:lactoylglutathione lyase